MNCATNRELMRYIANIAHDCGRLLQNCRALCIFYFNHLMWPNVQYQAQTPARVRNAQLTPGIGRRCPVCQQFLLRSERSAAGPLRDDPFAHQKHNPQRNGRSVWDVCSDLCTAQAGLSRGWATGVNSKTSRTPGAAKNHPRGGGVCPHVSGATWRYEHPQTRRTGQRALPDQHPLQRIVSGAVKKKRRKGFLSSGPECRTGTANGGISGCMGGRPRPSRWCVTMGWRGRWCWRPPCLPRHLPKIPSRWRRPVLCSRRQAQ